MIGNRVQDSKMKIKTHNSSKEIIFIIIKMLE